jgi:hypothetical protein
MEEEYKNRKIGIAHLFNTLKKTGLFSSSLHIKGVSKRGIGFAIFSVCSANLKGLVVK